MVNFKQWCNDELSQPDIIQKSVHANPKIIRDLIYSIHQESTHIHDKRALIEMLSQEVISLVEAGSIDSFWLDYAKEHMNSL